MFFKNYLITITSRVAGAVAVLLSLPLILEYLGPSEYSLIAFASLVQGYANILDAGLSPALAANVAKHCEHREQTLRIIKTSIYAFIIKFIKYALPLFLPLIVTAWVTLPSVSLERLTLLCVILLIDAFVSAIFRLQYSAMQGLGDHVLANSLHVLNIVNRTAIAVGIAIYSHQVEYLYISQVLITLMAILVNFCCYRFRRFTPLKEPVQDICTAQGNVTRDLTMIAIFLVIINSIPLIVLGRLGGGNELNHFFLAASLGGVVATLQGSLISVMIPTLSRELARPPSDNPLRDFRSISRKVVSVSFIFGGLGFCLAEPIVSMWIHKADVDLALLTTLFQLQLISLTFVSLTIVPYALSIPMGRTRIQLIGVGVYLLASCFIVPVARHFGNLETLGLMTMVLGVCFSIGYFIASIDLIRPNARYANTLIFIAKPVLCVATALIVASLNSKILPSFLGAPAWLISSGVYGILICGIFTFTCRNRSLNLRWDRSNSNGHRP